MVIDALRQITGRGRLAEAREPDHERRARRRPKSRALARRLEPLSPPIISIRVIPVDQKMLVA